MTRARILADYVAGGTTAAEFDFMDGVTSNVQTQLDAKAPKASPAFTGNVGIGTSTITYDGLTLHNSASAGYTYISITNDGTGTGSGNGFNVGVNANEDAILLNRESTNMLFSTAGTERMRITSSGDIETSTTGKVKQKGAFMQSSTHQALTLGY